MRYTKTIWFKAFLALAAPCLLVFCKKPLSTASKKSAEQTKKGYPVIPLPATADTSMAYWKGIDTLPKAPVKPLSVSGEHDKFVLMDGYDLEPVLTDPKIQQPGAINFDGNGRMYVLELRSYMLDADSKGTLQPVSGISRWEDKDNDGVYETGGVFVDSLVFPRFVLPFGPDCILTMESNQNIVYKYTDTDKDGKADKKEFFCDDFGRSGNVEHQQAFLYWGMDNWLYSTVNPFRVRWTPDGVLRESTGSNHAQWGISHDDDGKLWFQGGSNGIPSYFQFPIHYGDYIVKEGNFEEGFEEPFGAAVLVEDMQAGMAAVKRPTGNLKRVTGAAGNDVFRGDRLPKELYGQYFYGEPVARIVRRIAQTKHEGLTTLRNVYQGEKAEFIRSTDPLFRPVDMTTAPDGTMYITDMYHGIIQEGEWTPKGSYIRYKIEQYQLDKVIGLGRIWRLRYKGMSRDKTQPRMFDESAAELVKHFEHPNGWWRDKAQQLLVLRQDKSVVPLLKEMVQSSPKLEARFHALWTLEGLNALEPEMVKGLMHDANPRMRNVAMWVSETLYKNGDKSFADEYKALAKDENADVVIRAIMTEKLLQVPNYKEDVKNVLAANQAEGVQLVGKEILEPPIVHAFFGRHNPNHTEEQKAMLLEGQKIYNELCSTCHGIDGRGTPVGEQLMAPSFVGNAHVRGHADYVIKTILRGLTGPIEDKTYEGVVMVPMKQNSDKWVASVASFIRYGFENEASLVSEEEVSRVRKATESQESPFLFDELIASVPMEAKYKPDWNVSASHSAPIKKGGTGKPSGAFTFEGWTSGEAQNPDMWFMVEFPEEKTITEVDFSSDDIRQGTFRNRLPSLKTHPRMLKIEVSMNGKKWKEVWAGPSHVSPNAIQFDPVQAKYLRFKQTSSDEKAPWIMKDLKIYELRALL
ncbi:discoidin domain-containing protein [Marinilongibacter aquaticus]|uniref:DUF7133 domain-containing protein n=1 Tax=Marinilongibacter aquaticus TaxID=2975157 RepID=UPI0021BD936B|nr:discoidin domain-containing protein [Marinilongibacter aquaticus]UBM60402.1 discoidin domain-containing protein [Marinilongibacter aquaticus]